MWDHGIRAQTCVLFVVIISEFDGSQDQLHELIHGWPEGATGENVCSSRCFSGFHHQHIHLLQNDKFENIW